MEDANSGTIGTTSTPVGSPALVLMDEDSPRTPFSINTQKPTQSKKPYVNQSIVWDHFKKVEQLIRRTIKLVAID
jgi:hypothetical protein